MEGGGEGPPPPTSMEGGGEGSPPPTSMEGGREGCGGGKQERRFQEYKSCVVWYIVLVLPPPKKKMRVRVITEDSVERASCVVRPGGTTHTQAQGTRHFGTYYCSLERQTVLNCVEERKSSVVPKYNIPCHTECLSWHGMPAL